MSVASILVSRITKHEFIELPVFIEVPRYIVIPVAVYDQSAPVNSQGMTSAVAGMASPACEAEGRPPQRFEDLLDVYSEPEDSQVFCQTNECIPQVVKAAPYPFLLDSAAEAPDQLLQDSVPARAELDITAFADVPSNQWLSGTVVRVVPIGLIVSVALPGSNGSATGMVHITQIRDGKVENIRDEAAVGQAIWVRVREVVPETSMIQGRLWLTMRAAVDDVDDDVAVAPDVGPLSDEDGNGDPDEAWDDSDGGDADSELGPELDASLERLATYAEMVLQMIGQREDLRRQLTESDSALLVRAAQEAFDWIEMELDTGALETEQVDAKCERLRGLVNSVLNKYIAGELADAHDHALNFSRPLDPPVCAILGGTKVADNIQLITKLLDMVDILIIGGGVAFTFIKEAGVGIGCSLYDEEGAKLVPEIKKKASEKGVDLILPVDFLCSSRPGGDGVIKMGNWSTGVPEGFMGMDIGPKSIALNAAAIAKSKTIIWKGPMGVFEMDAFELGTKKMMEKIVEVTESGAISVIQGEDTAVACVKYSAFDKVSHCSNDGGATMTFNVTKTHVEGQSSCSCNLEDLD